MKYRGPQLVKVMNLHTVFHPVGVEILIAPCFVNQVSGFGRVGKCGRSVTFNYISAKSNYLNSTHATVIFGILKDGIYILIETSSFSSFLYFSLTFCLSLLSC